LSEETPHVEVPEEKVAEEAVEEAHFEPTEVPAEEKPTPIPTEEEKPIEAPKVPNIFVHEEQPWTGTLTGPRSLVVVDECKCYPMDGVTDNWVRQHNIPILPNIPEGIKLEGANKIANLAELTKKIEAQT